jgi:hypothetical protein
MFDASQVLYTLSAVCLGCTHVKIACIHPTITTQRALICLSTNLVKPCLQVSVASGQPYGSHSNFPLQLRQHGEAFQ